MSTKAHELLNAQIAAGLLVDRLRAAHTGCDPVLSLTLLPLLGAAARVANDLQALRAAVESVERAAKGVGHG